MRRYAKLFAATLTASLILVALAGVAVAGPLEIPLKKEGGTFVVPVQINGAITLEFTVDSGAADVSVPADVFSTLRRTGTIRDTDIIGERTYVLADGSQRKSSTFTIRSLKIGNTIVENVRGGVAPAQGSLLLGQSFLERFKSWSFDNTKHVLLLEPQTASISPQPAVPPSRSTTSTPLVGNAVFPTAVSPKYSNEAAGQARMHTCLEQYIANKSTDSNGGLLWIQKDGGYYSQCNQHLKP